MKKQANGEPLNITDEDLEFKNKKKFYLQHFMMHLNIIVFYIFGLVFIF